MLNQPRFRRCFQIESLAPDALFLLSDKQSGLLLEPLQQVLAPLIDGQRSTDEIIDQVLPQLLPEDASMQDMILAGAKVYHALMLMEQQGYLVENTDTLPSELEIFFDALNLQPRQAGQRLENTRVGVKTIGAISSSDLIATLASLQIHVSDDADIEIILTDDYLQADLAAHNQRALQLNRPWMLLKPVGTVIWIGPIFLPGKTGCWECLAQRLRANRPIEAYIQRHTGRSELPAPPTTAIASTVQTGLGIAATEVLKWVAQEQNQRLEGVLLTLDTLTLQTHEHFLVKRPQCNCCGDPSLSRQSLPVVLGNRKKNFTTDGGHRVIAPQETLQKYQHHISPITGVVRELTSISSAFDGLIHAYLARSPFAVMFDDLEALCRTLAGRGAGKGKTEQQARASGFCEAIERYSGVFQGDEPRITSNYQDLGEKAIHPNACINFSPLQYQTRQEWNTHCQGSFQMVPEPFDESRAVEWTPVWSMTEQTFKYLPTAYCYFGYPKPEQPDCWADSNGCAAGNNLEEAILQGFMELVERDSVALWWYNRLKKPQVDLESFNEPYFQTLQNYYQKLNRSLWVLDLTSDLEIPTFAAISRRTDRAVEDIVLGYGAHFDAKIAISRALTEMSQILIAVLHAGADGTSQYPPLADPLAVEWWQTATLENQPYLVADQDADAKVAADYRQTWSDNLLDDVRTCQQIVETKGMEMLVLDQTRPDVGLNVVRVVVPGLRHFWKRLGSGRLYDVPVQMGWLAAPLSENQLNPIPMWM